MFAVLLLHVLPISSVPDALFDLYFGPQPAEFQNGAVLKAKKNVVGTTAEPKMAR